jgi:hypothetical protein
VSGNHLKTGNNAFASRAQQVCDVYGTVPTGTINTIGIAVLQWRRQGENEYWSTTVPCCDTVLVVVKDYVVQSQDANFLDLVVRELYKLYGVAIPVGIVVL